MHTRGPVGISIHCCLSVACCGKSYITHHTHVCVHLTGLQSLLFPPLFHCNPQWGFVWAELTNYFETKKSIRIDVDWCCSIVCFVGLLAKNHWLMVALLLLFLSSHLKSLRAGNLSVIFHFLDSSLSDVSLFGQINVPSFFPTFDQEFINLTPALKWPLPTWFSTNPPERAVQ